MTEDRDPLDIVNNLPPEMFQEDPDAFLKLTPLQRLRWLDEVASFIYKYKGIAQTQKEQDE